MNPNFPPLVTGRPNYVRFNDEQHRDKIMHIFDITDEKRQLEIANIRAVHEFLELAFLEDYGLPTSQIKTILGVTPKGDEYQWGVYTFKKHKERKCGQEACWIVLKA